MWFGLVLHKQRTLTKATKAKKPAEKSPTQTAGQFDECCPAALRGLQSRNFLPTKTDAKLRSSSPHMRCAGLTCRQSTSLVVSLCWLACKSIWKVHAQPAECWPTYCERCNALLTNASSVYIWRAFACSLPPSLHPSHVFGSDVILLQRVAQTVSYSTLHAPLGSECAPARVSGSGSAWVSNAFVCFFGQGGGVRV